MAEGWSTAAPYLIVTVLAALWAVAEVLRSFESDTVRALKNRWSWAFIGVHIIASILVYGFSDRRQFPIFNPSCTIPVPASHMKVPKSHMEACPCPPPSAPWCHGC